MIRDADASSIDSEAPRVTGKVTFEEFEVMVSSRSNAKTAGHWKTILERAPLVKGTKKAIKKLHDLNAKKHSQEPNHDPLSERMRSPQTPEPLPQEKIDLTFIPLPPDLHNSPDPGSPVRSPPFHSSVSDPSAPTPDASTLSEREQALLNVKWSLSILAGIALFRRLILKI